MNYKEDYEDWVEGCEYGNHEYGDYDCPHCKKIWCWACNKGDQRDWGGPVECDNCGKEIDI